MTEYVRRKLGARHIVQCWGDGIRLPVGSLQPRKKDSSVDSLKADSKESASQVPLRK